MKRIRVFLVNDHEVVRLGLVTLLHDVPCVSAVGEADDYIIPINFP